MDILVLLIMTALIAGGGLFIASRPTRKIKHHLARKRVLKVRRRLPITALKGMVRKPTSPVSITAMNEVTIEAWQTTETQQALKEADGNDFASDAEIDEVVSRHLSKGAP